MRSEIKTVGIISCVFIGLAVLLKITPYQTRQGASPEEYKQYQESVRLQDEYHATLRNADKLFAEKEYEKAEEEYLYALKMAEGTGLEGVSRGALARFYENTNAFAKALEQVDAILRKNITDRGRLRYSELRSRLLKKIENIENSSTRETSEMK